MHTTLRATLLAALFVVGGITTARSQGVEVGTQTLNDLKLKLPVGSKILYTYGGAIEIVDLHTPANDKTYANGYQFARWSFDGNSIAAVRNFQVYEVDAATGTATPLGAIAAASTGITIEYHPNNAEILYVNSGLYAVQTTAPFATRLVTGFHAYDSEPCATLVQTTATTTEPRRVGARVHHDLYAIDVGIGDRLYDTGTVCSPVVSPGGSRMGNNTGNHDSVAFRDWDGSRHSEVLATGVASPVTGGKWDNFHWSNHPHFLTIQGDDEAPPINAYVMDISDFANPLVTVITNYTGADISMRNPDLYVEGVFSIEGQFTETGTGTPVAGAIVSFTGPSHTNPADTFTAITDDNGTYAIVGLLQNPGTYSFDGDVAAAPGLTLATGSPDISFIGASMTGQDFVVTVQNDDVAADDTLPDYWEFRHFGDAISAETDDDDNDGGVGDGYSNLQEYLAGTSPVIASVIGSSESDWSGCVPGSFAYGGIVMIALTGIGLALLRRRAAAAAVIALALVASAPADAAAPRGKPARKTAAEEDAAAAVGKQLTAQIAWSTSRGSGYHNIYIMDEDGENQRQLTDSKFVDWFARFSPDGKKVIFNRSKRRWVSETNAKYANRWNIHMIDADGSGEKLLIEDATWGTWASPTSILFSRGDSAYTFDTATGEEKLIIDGAAGLRRGVVLQQPQMSPDGKHVAITLRGRMRETGVWHLESESWTKVAGGCQINWFPSGKRMIRMNENTGRGGTEVFAFDVEDGEPATDVPYEELKFMDLPGRRSHEYFPVISRDGKWMVWCATARGHDHDIYDYEVHLWKIGEPVESVARLTYHTGNDRWPDIHIPAGD